MQSLEQKPKAQNDLTDVLYLRLFGIEHQKGTQTDAERSDTGYIQSDQDAGDGGTDVGTEDYAGCLCQVHDTGIDKAHDHYGGGGGGLNDHGDEYTQQEAEDSVSGQLLKKILHLRTGCQLQSVTHIFHTEQECAQAAQQLNDIGDSHGNPSRKRLSTVFAYFYKYTKASPVLQCFFCFPVVLC